MLETQAGGQGCASVRLMVRRFQSCQLSVSLEHKQEVEVMHLLSRRLGGLRCQFSACLGHRHEKWGSPARKMSGHTMPMLRDVQKKTTLS